MGRIKISGGTVKDPKETLCRTCSHGTYMRGLRDSQEVVKCSIFESQVHFKVVDCNGFNSSAEPSLYDMKQIAWVLVTKEREGKFGFISGKQYKKEYKEEFEVPDPTY